MKEEWFVTRELVEQIRADMAEHVGFGSGGLDQQIERSLAGLDAKHLDSVVKILGIAALIVKRLANERGREEDELQESEYERLRQRGHDPMSAVVETYRAAWAEAVRSGSVN